MSLRDQYRDNILRDSARTFAIIGPVSIAYAAWLKWDHPDRTPIVLLVALVSFCVAVVVGHQIDGEKWSKISAEEHREYLEAKRAPWDRLSDIGREQLERVRSGNG